MLTNFAEGSTIDAFWAPECASECNSVKSYNNVAWETILKNQFSIFTV